MQEADEDEDEGEELSEDGENKVGGIVREYLSEFPPRIHQGVVVALVRTWREVPPLAFGES